MRVDKKKGRKHPGTAFTMHADKKKLKRHVGPADAKKKKLKSQPEGLITTDAEKKNVKKHPGAPVTKDVSKKKMRKRPGAFVSAALAKKQKHEEPIKIDWKAYKSEKKSLKVKRKQADGGSGSYEVGMKAKVLWEEMRREDCPKERKEALGQQLHNTIKGKIKELVYAHDTVRAVECLVSVGNGSINYSIFEELKDEIVKMTKSMYASFFVKKMLKHGSKEQKKTIIKAFKGKVVKLMKHKDACRVVEAAYSTCANSTERAIMRREFYGKEFTVLNEAESSESLQEILKTHPKKEAVLQHLRENIQAMIDKELLTPSLFHALVREYLTLHEGDKEELIEQLREHLVDILHTRDGARVACMCLWNGRQKDRKVAIKSFKGHVVEMCKEEHGHLVLLAAFDCIDDTVLLSKAIVSEILDRAKEVAQHEYGRKVLLYLVCPRSPTHCHPDILAILREGDGNLNSKKEMPIRQKELLAAVSKPLLTHVASDVEGWMATSALSIVTRTIVTDCVSPAKAATLEAIALWAATKASIEDPAIHMFLKRLIQGDKISGGSYFSIQVLEALQDVNLWISCNRGAFTFVCMLETDIEEIGNAVRQKLEPFIPQIEQQTSKGASILLNKLNVNKQ